MHMQTLGSARVQPWKDVRGAGWSCERSSSPHHSLRSRPGPLRGSCSSEETSLFGCVVWEDGVWQESE
jgi:hypothetical protein